MTEERKQEILEIIRNTNRRPAQTGKPLYPEEIMAYPNLCEEIESISRTVDGFSYRMDILRARTGEKTARCLSISMEADLLVRTGKTILISVRTWQIRFMELR